MKQRIARLGTWTLRIALIPLQVLFFTLFMLGLVIAGAILGVLRLLIAARSKSADALPVGHPA